MSTKACRTPKSCATLVLRAAKQVRFRGLYASDPDARRMYLKDARNMVTVARRVAAGDKRGAYNKAFSMDTAAREQIPMEVFCWIDPEIVRGGCR